MTLYFSGTRGTDVETRITNTINQDRDFPVEKTPQNDGQEGIEANIPRISSTTNRLHLEQKKLSGTARRRLQEQPEEDYFGRRRRRQLVKLILIQGAKMT